MGRLFRRRLRLAAFAVPVQTEFADQRGRPHSLDETGPRQMDGREKIASSIVDTRQLPQIDFDPLVWAQRGTPSVFCFGDPRTLEPAREFQPANITAFANRDSQHDVTIGTMNAKFVVSAKPQ